MELIHAIIADPLTYLLAVALFVGRFYLERRIPRAVDYRFEQKLADHGHSLTLLAEQARFDFQRRLTSDNIYSAKKHEVAASVYAGFRIAHGYVSGLFGLREALSFAEFNSDDLKTYLESRDVPQGKQAEILAQWAVDKAQARSILDPYLRMLDIQAAEQKLNEAKNNAYLNELYLTEAAGQAINALVGPLSEWVTNAKHPSWPRQGWRPDHAALAAALTALHNTLRDELAPRGPTDVTARHSEVGPNQ